jgi:hypothetical protein
MKHKCPVCSQVYELTEKTLPCCPNCVKGKMVHPDGLSSKHRYGTAPANASYVGDGVDTNAVLNYMASDSQTGPSGCIVFYSPKYNSYNAVSYKPLGDIPGSGNFGGTPQAAQFAVLFDIEGKTSQGPHWSFEEEGHLNQRVAKREWVTPNVCSVCGKIPVFVPGDTCVNCRAGGT